MKNLKILGVFLGMKIIELILLALPFVTIFFIYNYSSTATSSNIIMSLFSIFFLIMSWIVTNKITNFYKEPIKYLSQVAGIFFVILIVNAVITTLSYFIITSLWQKLYFMNASGIKESAGPNVYYIVGIFIVAIMFIIIVISQGIWESVKKVVVNNWNLAKKMVDK